MKLTIIIEKSEGELWGRIENVPDYLPVTSGATIEEIEQNLRALIDDYVENEGSAYNEWKSVKSSDVQFDHVYDLSAFFEVFDDVKVVGIARRAGINPSLVRHYVAGTKYPSPQQAKRLEMAIRELGDKLREVVLA
jgi:predicted RNase H-like HicB family nuclease